jgi:hypothetical protein
LSLRELSKTAVKECKTLSARLPPSRSDRESKTRARSQKTLKWNCGAANLPAAVCAETIQVSLQARFSPIRYLLLLREPISICAAHLFFASIPFLK